MTNLALRALAASFAASVAIAAIAPAAQAQDEKPTPGSIVNAADPSEWKEIAAEDLLVMTLPDDAHGKERTVVIQLMPAPLSQTWVANIRTLARAGWWDGLSIYRSVDNWVVQWGDGEEDAEDRTRPARPHPDGMAATSEDDYDIAWQADMAQTLWGGFGRRPAQERFDDMDRDGPSFADPYSAVFGYLNGIPFAGNIESRVDKDGERINTPTQVWPVHCYGSVGVARDLSPDAGTGAELYAVIGHAPRPLDRNIAVVGRVISGMANLSILPRGTGDYGVYKTEAEHTPIVSVKLASEMPEAERPHYEYLDTDGASFAAYADIIANRDDAFYTVGAGGADVCNVRVPTRPVKDDKED